MEILDYLENRVNDWRVGQAMSYEALPSKEEMKERASALQKQIEEDKIRNYRKAIVVLAEKLLLADLGKTMSVEETFEYASKFLVLAQNELSAEIVVQKI